MINSEISAQGPKGDPGDSYFVYMGADVYYQEGNIVVPNGNLHAKTLCDADGRNCIQTSDFKRTIWSHDTTAGTFKLQEIFDRAHWKASRFEASVNYYTAQTHADYPHKYFNIRHYDAGSSGCAGGITSMMSDTGFLFLGRISNHPQVTRLMAVCL